MIFYGGGGLHRDVLKFIDFSQNARLRKKCSKNSCDVSALM